MMENCCYDKNCDNLFLVPKIGSNMPGRDEFKTKEEFYQYIADNNYPKDYEIVCKDCLLKRGNLGGWSIGELTDWK